MFWQCSECGGLIDAAPRRSVCPECGTASTEFVSSPESVSDFCELRDFWVQVGMAQERPLLDFVQ